MSIKKVIALVIAALIAGVVLGSFGIATAGTTHCRAEGRSDGRCRACNRGLPQRRRHLRQGRGRHVPDRRPVRQRRRVCDRRRVRQRRRLCERRRLRHRRVGGRLPEPAATAVRAPRRTQ